MIDERSSFWLGDGITIDHPLSSPLCFLYPPSEDLYHTRTPPGLSYSRPPTQLKKLWMYEERYFSCTVYTIIFLHQHHQSHLSITSSCWLVGYTIFKELELWPSPYSSTSDFKKVLDVNKYKMIWLSTVWPWGVQHRTGYWYMCKT